MMPSNFLPLTSAPEQCHGCRLPFRHTGPWQQPAHILRVGLPPPASGSLLHSPAHPVRVGRLHGDAAWVTQGRSLWYREGQRQREEAVPSGLWCTYPRWCDWCPQSLELLVSVHYYAIQHALCCGLLPEVGASCRAFLSSTSAAAGLGWRRILRRPHRCCKVCRAQAAGAMSAPCSLSPKVRQASTDCHVSRLSAGTEGC